MTNVFSSSWIASNLVKQVKLGESNVSPIWQCIYRVGDSGDFTFGIRVAKQECPQVVFYNIENNKWSLEYPMDTF